MGYNGWKNYETWATSMFLDGNYTGLSEKESVLELVNRMLLDEGEDLHLSTLAEEIKEYVQEAIDIEGGSLAADLLGATLSQVDWLTLTDYMIKEIGETTSS